MSDRVYLLIHDDRDYDMGDKYVRGVYATEAAAKEAVATRTPSGAISRRFDAHSEYCCDVEAFDLLDESVLDVRRDLVPWANTGGHLIPEAVAEQLAAKAERGAFLDHVRAVGDQVAADLGAELGENVTFESREPR